LVLSGAGGELTNNVLVEETTCRISRDKTLVDGLIDTLIGITTTVGEHDSEGACGGVVGSLTDKAAGDSGTHLSFSLLLLSVPFKVGTTPKR